MVWSPSGAAGRGGPWPDIASAEVRIFAADGAALATYPGTDVAWLDDRRFVTLERQDRRLTAGTLTLRSLDERSSIEIGHLADIASRGAASSRPAWPCRRSGRASTEFVIITASGAARSGQGLPVVWSPDGSRLVVLRDLRGRQARLAIVGYPDLADRPIPTWMVAAAPAPVFDRTVTPWPCAQQGH